MSHDDPWAEYADDWDEDEGARIYARSAHDHLLELLEPRGPSLDGAVICDFGCGTGLLAERLVAQAARIDAVDTSPAMLQQVDAKIAAHGWKTVTSARMVPATEGTHDLVVCSSVLSFVDHLDATVASLTRLLRPGGALIHWDWERTDDHDHGLTRHEIRHALTSAGLTQLHVGPAFAFRVEGTPVWPVVGAGWKPDLT